MILYDIGALPDADFLRIPHELNLENKFILRIFVYSLQLYKPPVLLIQRSNNVYAIFPA